MHIDPENITFAGDEVGPSGLASVMGETYVFIYPRTSREVSKTCEPEVKANVT